MISCHFLRIFSIFPLFRLIYFDSLANCERALDVTLAKFGANEQFSRQERKFLLYGVNPGEGFNLRRDVYMRVANTVRQLREKGHNYILVLPPWIGLYHWYRRGERSNFLHPWRQFFDVRSLSDFVPVIEYENFLKEAGNAVDIALYLQHYTEGWDENSGFQLKFDKRPCINGDRRNREEIERSFYSPDDQFYVINLICLSIQGQSSTLTDAILSNNLINNSETSLLVHRAETILHDRYGDVFYWRARRSMRYAKVLREIADEFREKIFHSSYERDGMPPLAADWRNDVVGRRLPKGAGGKYLAVHWRRADFLRAHVEDLPSIEGTSRQILALCEQLDFRSVFLSTDADKDEIDALEKLLATKRIRLNRFRDKMVNGTTLSEGQIAIIDQWICAHAKYFIGTHQSTFSYRIQEDREILGFPPSTTFNRLCPDGKYKNTEKLMTCEQPAKWTIVYNEDEYIQYL